MERNAFNHEFNYDTKIKRHRNLEVLLCQIRYYILTEIDKLDELAYLCDPEYPTEYINAKLDEHPKEK